MWEAYLPKETSDIHLHLIKLMKEHNPLRQRHKKNRLRKQIKKIIDNNKNTIPFCITDLAEMMHLSSGTLYTKGIKILWECGLIDVHKSGHGKYITVYTHPFNNFSYIPATYRNYEREYHYETETNSCINTLELEQRRRYHIQRIENMKKSHWHYSIMTDNEYAGKFLEYLVESTNGFVTDSELDIGKFDPIWLVLTDEVIGTVLELTKKQAMEGIKILSDLDLIYITDAPDIGDDIKRYAISLIEENYLELFEKFKEVKNAISKTYAYL